MIRKFIEFFKENPNLAISVPTLLCFVQFSYEVFEIIDTGVFDSNAFNQLVSSANGFETVCLCFIMLVLKSKKK